MPANSAAKKRKRIQQRRGASIQWEWIDLLLKAIKEACENLQKESIKLWYILTFPEDELGDDISPSATFKGAQKNLGSIYEYIGVHDSVVRERVFSELSERMGVSYAEIYDQWLNLSNA